MFMEHSLVQESGVMQKDIRFAVWESVVFMHHVVLTFFCFSSKSDCFLILLLAAVEYRALSANNLIHES